jgi:hypothetical protein
MRSAPAIFPQLTLQTASKHLDRRALRRICEIEADNLGGLARRCVVELEDRVPGRFEETVAGFEQLNRLAFQLKMKASGRHHPHSRDRMAMQSSRLPRREFDPCAFDQRTVGFAAGSSSSRRGSRLSGGKGVSAMFTAAPSPSSRPRAFAPRCPRSACRKRPPSPDGSCP